MSSISYRASDLAATGIPGLDDILIGGLLRSRLYLIEGKPGTGKTTLAMQFLMEGVRQGEAVLYITLSESVEELHASAASHGWSLEKITIRELVPAEENLRADEQYTMFHPSEIELSETIQAVLTAVEQLNPTRIVFDSLSELRLVAGNALRFRRQILALKKFLSSRNCTVLLLDDMTSEDHDLQVQSIAHGVIFLERLIQDYGAERRRLQIVKYRSRTFRGGFHDYLIRHGGLNVFPRLIASEHGQPSITRRLSSGLPELDNLLGGGIEQGTSTLILGAAGTGKSTLATLFATSAAKQNMKASMFIFDETLNTLLARADALGLDLSNHLKAQRVRIRQIDPAELSPGEFASIVRESIERDQSTLVVIDSLNGFLNAMPEERFLVIHLHELLTYLAQMGVVTVVVGAHQGIIGPQIGSPVDASYLADAVIMMRYYEAEGEIRQVISVIKKRGGPHERSIRDFRMSDGGIHVGEPLRNYRGVLTGVPVLDDSKEPLS